VGHVARRDAAQTRAAGLVDRELHGALGHHDAEGAVALEHGGGRRIPQDADIGLRVEQAQPDHRQVARHPRRAVRLDTAQVRLHQHLGHGGGVGRRRSGGGEDLLDEPPEPLRRNPCHIRHQSPPVLAFPVVLQRRVARPSPIAPLPPSRRCDGILSGPS
jgi:hypothetical protein